MLGKGGSLTVKAAKVDGEEEIRLQVIDTGPGIPEKVIPKIFEPFFTTKGTTKKGEAKGTAWAWRSAKTSSPPTGGGLKCNQNRQRHNVQRISARQRPRQLNSRITRYSHTDLSPLQTKFS